MTYGCCTLPTGTCLVSNPWLMGFWNCLRPRYQYQVGPTLTNGWICWQDLFSQSQCRFCIDLMFEYIGLFIQCWANVILQMLTHCFEKNQGPMCVTYNLMGAILNLIDFLKNYLLSEFIRGIYLL